LRDAIKFFGFVFYITGSRVLLICQALLKLDHIIEPAADKDVMVQIKELYSSALYRLLATVIS